MFYNYVYCFVALRELVVTPSMNRLDCDSSDSESEEGNNSGESHDSVAALFDSSDSSDEVGICFLTDPPCTWTRAKR